MNTAPLNISCEKEVREDLEKNLRYANLLTIGEVHGVKENAEFYYWVFTNFKFQCIALEYPHSHKKPIEYYLSHGTLPKDYHLEQPSDGRINLEYIEMLKALWDLGLLKHLIFFDVEKNVSTWNERDAIYAEEFMKEYKAELRTLLIAGNYHTRTTKFTSDSEDGKLIPMCYHLKSRLGSLPHCEIKYHAGSFYNFGTKQFNGNTPPCDTNCIKKVQEQSYEFHLLNFTPVTLF